MLLPPLSSEKAPIFYLIRLASYAVMTLDALGHFFQPIATVDEAVPLESLPSYVVCCTWYLQAEYCDFQAARQMGKAW